MDLSELHVLTCSAVGNILTVSGSGDSGIAFIHAIFARDGDGSRTNNATSDTYVRGGGGRMCGYKSGDMFGE